MPTNLSGTGNGVSNVKCFKNNTYVQPPYTTGEYEVIKGSCKSNIANAELDSTTKDNIGAIESNGISYPLNTLYCNEQCNNNYSCQGYTINNDNINPKCTFYGNKDIGCLETDKFFTTNGKNVTKDLRISKTDTNPPNNNVCMIKKNFNPISNYENDKFNVCPGKATNIIGNSLTPGNINNDTSEVCLSNCYNDPVCQGIELGNINGQSNTCSYFNIPQNNDPNQLIFSGNGNVNNLTYIKKAN